MTSCVKSASVAAHSDKISVSTLPPFMWPNRPELVFLISTEEDGRPTISLSPSSVPAEERLPPPRYRSVFYPDGNFVTFCPHYCREPNFLTSQLLLLHRGPRGV